MRWALDRAQLPRVAGAHPGIVAVREVGPPPASPQRTAPGGLPARLLWPVRRVPVLGALTPLVCEVRFAPAGSPGAPRQP